MPHLKNLKKCINKLIQELKKKEVSMDIRIQSIHFDASEQLQAFIQKKVSKLEKYYEDIKKVEVSLKVVKPEVAENKEAGIKILVPNGEFYASKVCDTFEEAIDLDVEALGKQLVKYKEKQRNK
jgi:putative sigma-54 modulation protein